MAHAAPLLERYRNTHLVFNDDIQGTATCAVGGVYGAMAVLGTPLCAPLAHLSAICTRPMCMSHHLLGLVVIVLVATCVAPLHDQNVVCQCSISC